MGKFLDAVTISFARERKYLKFGRVLKLPHVLYIIANANNINK
jgi:hypothetical protein